MSLRGSCITSFQISCCLWMVRMSCSTEWPQRPRIARQQNVSRNDGHVRTRGKQDKATKEALTFVKQKVDAAKWFVDAIVQRQRR